jgi:hypothetical protein
MILVSGGFGWNGIKAAENLKELDLSEYDKVITNGMTGFCLCCYKLGKNKLLSESLNKIVPFLNKIDKDYFFMGNIKNCLYLSKNFGDLNYEIKDTSEINFNLEIELINLKTEEIKLITIETLKDAYFYSTLIPGIRPPFNWYYNTASLSRTPCYSLLKLENEDIHVCDVGYDYYKYSSIQRTYKTIQVMRSKYFYEICLEILKKNNNIKNI